MKKSKTNCFKNEFYFFFLRLGTKAVWVLFGFLTFNHLVSNRKEKIKQAWSLGTVLNDRFYLKIN